MWPRQMRTHRILSRPKPPSSSVPSPTPPLFAWIMLGSVPCLRVPGPSVAGGVLAQLWWALRSHHSIESWPVVQDSDATPGSCPLAGVARSAFVQAGPGPAGAHGSTAGLRRPTARRPESRAGLLWLSQIFRARRTPARPLGPLGPRVGPSRPRRAAVRGRPLRDLPATRRAAGARTEDTAPRATTTTTTTTRRLSPLE